MSFNFGCGKKVPSVDEALRFAIRHGVVPVASAGNLGSEACVSPPATSPGVIGVGGTTEGGCLGDYSLSGKDIDVLAPGGGEPIAGCPSVLDRPDLPGDLQGRQREPLRRAQLLRRHLDGRRPRLRRRRDDPRQRRPRPEQASPARSTPRSTAQAEEDRPQHRPLPAAAGRRADRRRPATDPLPVRLHLERAAWRRGLRSCG